MANEKSKKKVNLWLDKSLVAQLDGICARDGVSRATVVNHALHDYFNLTSSSAQIKALDSRLDAIEQQHQAQAALILDAIQNQPIAAMQQPQPPKHKILRFLN